MKYTRRIVIFWLFLFLLSGATTAVATTFVTISTGGLTGVYYPTGGAIAKIVNQYRRQHGVRCTVESTDGSVFNVNAVMDGRLEFGIVQSDRQYQAVRGLNEWQEKGPQTELRAVFSIYAETCSLLAADDAGIRTLSDLKGKTVNLGNRGSGHLGNSLDVLKSIGLDPAKDLNARYINPVQAPRLLQDGQLDAFFYTVGHPSAALKEATAGSRQIRFIPLDDPRIGALVDSLPYYSRMTIPIRLYPGARNPSDIATFGVSATLVTSAKVPDDVVYAITWSIFEHLQDFKQLHPAYSLSTRTSMLTCLSAPIHPGALRYFNEKGLLSETCE